MKRLLLACALLCAALPAWSATYEETFTPKANKAYNEDINVWVYTSEFAERFGMPERWVDDELEGAYAVAFRVEVSSARLMFPHKGKEISKPQRDCILDVYLPADAEIPWIDDQLADFKYYTPDSPSYLAPQTPSDQKWRRRAVGVPHPGERARRPLVRLNGGTLFVREFDKKVYPGVMYISFNMGCMTPPRRQSSIEFCEDRRWGSRGCRALHRIRIPVGYMEGLYKDWKENSRTPAQGEWRGAIEGN